MNLGQSKTIHQNSAMGFIGFNSEGAIVYSSKKISDIFSTEIKSTTQTKQLFSQYPPLFLALLKAIQGQSSSLEIEINDKYFLVEMILPSPLSQKADILAAFTDITFFKHKEKALEQKVEQLHSLNKELEHFAYVTSHDLREPFRTATNFAQLIKKKHASNLDAEANSYLQYIINGSKNGQHLVNDLLSYYRVCKAEMEPLFIQPEEIILLQIYNLKETIDVKDASINIDSDKPIYADPKWLGSIFYHLLKNAIIHNIEEQPKIDITINSLDKEHIITVQDNGIGIDEQHHESIFQLLMKVDSRPNLKGSGVGLSICKKIVDLHQGKIFLESKLGEGSKFVISLPKDN